MNSNVDILTTAEAAELAQAGAVIRDGMTAFMAVGTALLRIQQKRLYRATHDTFETYLRERWSISRSRGYQLIEAASTVGELSTIVDTTTINKEAQARELARIARAEGIDQAAAVLDALDGNPTAKAIRDQAAATLADRRMAQALAAHGIDTVDPALLLIPEHGEWDFNLLLTSVGMYGWEKVLPPVEAIAEDDGSLTLIDGRARLLVALELDNPAPVRVRPAADVGDRFGCVYSANVLRRHLTMDQAAMVTAQLIHDMEAADFGDADTVDMGADFAVLSFKWSADVCRRHLDPEQQQALRLVKAASQVGA